MFNIFSLGRKQGSWGSVLHRYSCILASLLKLSPFVAVLKHEVFSLKHGQQEQIASNSLQNSQAWRGQRPCRLRRFTCKECSMVKPLVKVRKNKFITVLFGWVDLIHFFCWDSGSRSLMILSQLYFAHSQVDPHCDTAPPHWFPSLSRRQWGNKNSIQDTHGRVFCLQSLKGLFNRLLARWTISSGDHGPYLLRISTSILRREEDSSPEVLGFFHFRLPEPWTVLLANSKTARFK